MSSHPMGNFSSNLLATVLQADLQERCLDANIQYGSRWTKQQLVTGLLTLDDEATAADNMDASAADNALNTDADVIAQQR